MSQAQPHLLSTDLIGSYKDPVEIKEVVGVEMSNFPEAQNLCGELHSIWEY